jgi:hypothetical protein
MYPQVVQFETRHQQFALESQLIRERRQTPASNAAVEPKRAAQAHAGERAPREPSVSAFSVRIVAFLTGTQPHKPPVPNDVLPR